MLPVYQPLVSSDGRLQVTTTGAIDSVSGAFGFVGEEIRVSTDSVSNDDTFNHGLRFNQSGHLLVVDDAGDYTVNGFRVSSDGRLCVNSGANSGGNISNGLYFLSNGRLSVDGVSGGETFNLLTEGGDTLVTEGGDNLVQEN